MHGCTVLDAINFCTCTIGALLPLRIHYYGIYIHVQVYIVGVYISVYSIQVYMYVAIATGI